MRNRSALLITLFATLVVGLAALYASDGLEDGRINVGPHVGGNAVYCVDANHNPANSYDPGGIKVLSTEGNELLFAPGDQLAALVGQAKKSELAENTLVISAPGPYGFGSLSLYVLTSGHFQLNGYDEHGSPYAFIWEGCIPVRPATGGPEPTATPIRQV